MVKSCRESVMSWFLTESDEGDVNEERGKKKEEEGKEK